MNKESPEKGRRSRLGWILGIGLLVALVLLVQQSVGWRALLAPWTALPAGSVGAALGLVLTSYGFRTIRIHEYFRPNTSGRFGDSFRLVLLHNLFNNLLPMRSGEASFPILMQREFRVPFSRSIPGLVYLRFLDLHFLLLLASLVLVSGRGAWGWLLPFLLLPLPVIAFLTQERLRPRLETRKGGPGSFMRKALSGLPAAPRLFWTTWCWTAVNWGVKLMVFAWVLRAFTPMRLSTALMGSVTGELSSVLPFHGLAGAGTYEAGVMAGLLPLGIAPGPAVTGAVNLHLFVLGASVLSGTLALLLPRKRGMGKLAHGAPLEGAAADARENPGES